MILINFLLGKIGKKFDEKIERIKELEDILKDKSIDIEKKEVELNTKSDFIDKLLDNSKAINEFVLGSDKDKKTKMSYQEKVERGMSFEKQVAKYFEDLDYKVDHRGLKYKKVDKGIDILAKKEDTYILIQCKNYAATTRIKHNLVKEFNSNCFDFITKNSEKLNIKNTRFLLIVSNESSLQSCAINYIKDDGNKCECREIKYMEQN